MANKRSTTKKVLQQITEAGLESANMSIEGALHETMDKLHPTTSPAPRKMTKAEAGRKGGKATKTKHPEQFSEMGKKRGKNTAVSKPTRAKATKKAKATTTQAEATSVYTTTNAAMERLYKGIAQYIDYDQLAKAVKRYE